MSPPRCVSRASIDRDKRRDVVLPALFLELLIAMLHTFLLPAAVWAEIGFKWHIIFVAIAGGLFQFYSVGMRDLRCRYYSTVIATIVAFLTVEQYMMTGLLLGTSRPFLLLKEGQEEEEWGRRRKRRMRRMRRRRRTRVRARRKTRTRRGGGLIPSDVLVLF